jgi:uncharacterized protein YdbL (DUF1318 family)
MALIHVPRPENAWNPNRPANALLKSQIVHLHDAELKLPVRQQTDIYVNAIKTEGEAADYVRQVTEAIHAAHQAAAAKRARSRVKRTSKVRTKKKKTPNARRRT